MNINIHQAKQLVRDHQLTVKDISGSRSYGYEFGIFRTEQVEGPIPYTRTIGEPLLTSVTVHEPKTINKLGNPGAYRQMFNRDEVLVLLS